MFELFATVQNAHGIHCRPSAVIVKEVMAYRGEITVSDGSRTCDPKSVMNLIALGLQQGNTVKIAVSGPDEEQMCRHLVELFEKHFDFPPRTSENALPLPFLETSRSLEQP